MTLIDPASDHDLPFGAQVPVHKMPAHWLMARLGKRVLRPGGREMTRWMIEQAGVGPGDHVVELAPGLGVTARELVARGPASYAGVERDASAVAHVQRALSTTGHHDARVLRGDASRTTLPDGCASVVVGEAMLSMHSVQQKRAILAEARRILRPGGRYAIHELAVSPDDLAEATLAQIERDLSRTIHVGVRVGTPSRWRSWLEDEGFVVEHQSLSAMSLLEPARLVRDEGLVGTARFALHALLTPGAARRLSEVRAVFSTHARHLRAVAIVARKPPRPS